MSNLHDSHASDNTATATDLATDTQAPADDAALESGLSDQEQAFVSDDDAAVNRLVGLTADTLDPKDMLKKYAKLGAECLKIARKRQASFKAWSKDDFDSLCNELERKVKLRVAIKKVEMAKYVRIHLWVEALRPDVPEVEKLSYYQAYNKFVPTTLLFDGVDLTGELRSEWHTWTVATVRRQLGDDKLSIADLDASIADRKAEIDREKAAKKDPEKALLQEQKAAEAKAKKDRRDSQQRIMDSLDGAITNGHADVNDVIQIVEQALKANKLALPTTMVGFDPATCTKNDCRILIESMFSHNKAAELKYLRDLADARVKQIENAMIATQAG